jgi:membrane protease YdiL (CAAX protease family)
VATHPLVVRLRAMGRAVLLWVLGDIPEHPRAADATALVVLVAFTAAFGMWLGMRWQPRGDTVLIGAWRGVVHGGLALAALVVWHLRCVWKTRKEAPVAWAGHFVGLVGAGLMVALVAGRFGDTVERYKAAPLETFVLPAVVAAVLAFVGLKLAKFDFASWGVGLGDWRWWLPHHGVLLTAVLPLAALTTTMVKALSDFYPVDKEARVSLDGFAWSHFGLALDMLGWEFLFRGFLLFGMSRRGDTLMAIFVQAFPFFVLHHNKPHVELLSSFPGGILAGWFCLRARSFLPLYVIHLSMITVVGFTAFVMRNGW